MEEKQRTESCFCKCKDTKLKAIHNSLSYNDPSTAVVFANAKILNWKQFTTTAIMPDNKSSCFCKCKDTKLKAIHNTKLGIFAGSRLFLQMQRY